MLLIGESTLLWTSNKGNLIVIQEQGRSEFRAIFKKHSFWWLLNDPCPLRENAILNQSYHKQTPFLNLILINLKSPHNLSRWYLAFLVSASIWRITNTSDERRHLSQQMPTASCSCQRTKAMIYDRKLRWEGSSATRCLIPGQIRLGH